MHFSLTNQLLHLMKVMLDFAEAMVLTQSKAKSKENMKIFGTFLLPINMQMNVYIANSLDTTLDLICDIDKSLTTDESIS